MPANTFEQAWRLLFPNTGMFNQVGYRNVLHTPVARYITVTEQEVQACCGRHYDIPPPAGREFQGARATNKPACLPFACSCGCSVGTNIMYRQLPHILSVLFSLVQFSCALRIASSLQWIEHTPQPYAIKNFYKGKTAADLTSGGVANLGSDPKNFDLAANAETQGLSKY